MVAGEDADRLKGKTLIDDNIGCDNETGEALVDNRVVDVVKSETAEVGRGIADVSKIEETTDSIVGISEKLIEESSVEVATEGTVEVVGGVTGTEELPKTVESATVDKSTVAEGDVGTALNDADTPEEVTRTVDKVAVVEDDVRTALVERATPKDVAMTVDKAVDVEDGAGTALEERLSAFIMSAAFSATPYTTACKCAAGIIGNIPASTTLKFCVPTQIAELAWLL